MIKRLIICADGTWNSPNQTDHNVSSPTNVVKLASAVSPFDDQGVAQMIYYHAGVGARGGYLDKFSGGAWGVGISHNIRELYLFLVLNYNPGDELFLFGFSRGAYTVRSLAGLIRNCGILKSQYVDKYQEAYELYRDRTDKTHPKAARSMRFREQFSWPDFSIKCIGVWDTVGALGIPLPIIGKKLWEFHDVELNSYVDFAFQALAIDEQRETFTPCVWIKQPNSAATQVLEQAWFPGVHSNVGGGYQDTGLSDCALEWMSQKAAGCGLALDEHTGLSPNPGGIIIQSMKSWYRLLGIQERTIGAKLPQSFEQLSPTALKRNELIPSYKPKNVYEFIRKTKIMEEVS